MKKEKININYVLVMLLIKVIVIVSRCMKVVSDFMLGILIEIFFVIEVYMWYVFSFWI